MKATIIYNRASGSQIEKGELKNQDWVSPTYNLTADGALYFNVRDIAKWDPALYTEKLAYQSSLDRMWTVFKLNRGKPNPGHSGFARVQAGIALWTLAERGSDSLLPRALSG